VRTEGSLPLQHRRVRVVVCAVVSVGAARSCGVRTGTVYCVCVYGVRFFLFCCGCGAGAVGMWIICECGIIYGAWRRHAAWVEGAWAWKPCRIIIVMYNVIHACSRAARFFYTSISHEYSLLMNTKFNKLVPKI